MEDSIDFKFLLEMDNNPLIVFNNDGMIIFLNNNAEFLLSYVSSKEIFNLAINNAPKDYGNKTIQTELRYGHLNFYATNVSYNCDNWIAIRLYYRPRDKKLNYKYDFNNEVLTDINMLLDLAIRQFNIDSQIDIKLFTDTYIPKIYLNQNNFLKLIRKTLNSYRDISPLNITLKLGIGEHIIINKKRYPLINLNFSSVDRCCSEDSSIEELAGELFLVCNFKNNNIELEIPLITKVD